MAKFSEKKLLDVKQHVFWFSLRLLFQTFLIVRKILRYIVKNVETSSCKVPLFLSDFNETWVFFTDFRKKVQISGLIKICPVGDKLFHADGQTDRERERERDRQTDRHGEANSRFSQFCEKRLKYGRAGRATWIYNTAHAHCMLANQDDTHT